MGSATTILVKDLMKRYGKAETLALKGLNFHVDRGEVFGYLGPNGAGKTTTIRILAGLSRQTAGYCQIFQDWRPCVFLPHSRECGLPG